MREREVVYNMISTLRVDGVHERREFNSKPQETAASYQQSTLLQVPGGISSVQALREGLKFGSVGEQLYRLRQSVALAQLYNAYARTQADPYAFLYLQQKQELSVKSLTASRKRKRVIRQDSFGIRLTGTGHLLINSHTRGRLLLFLPVTVAPTWQTPARDG